MSVRTVRILPDRTGPNGNYRPGQTVEVDDQRAAVLVETGHGEYADLPPEPETVAAPPFAVPTPVRKARGGK